MKSQHIGLLLLIVAFLVGCQQQETVIIPTLAQLPSPTTSPTHNPPTSSPTALLPSATATLTLTPTATTTQAFTINISITLTPTITLPPTMTNTPLPEAFVFGKSVLGREIIAYRVGTGGHIIMLVGGIHAGYEEITIRLVNQLRDHFRQRPRDILDDVTLIFIPALNPDGQQLGRELSGRFNANGVDLNRNWDCDWSAEAFFRDEQVNAGSKAFSEPETIALAGLIFRLQPKAVLFYHAAADGVFAGSCGDQGRLSSDLAAVYGQGASYPYGMPFDDYVVTGTAPSWVTSLGIASVDVELSSADNTEFERNLLGVRAVQAWAKQQFQ